MDFEDRQWEEWLAQESDSPLVDMAVEMALESLDEEIFDQAMEGVNIDAHVSHKNTIRAVRAAKKEYKQYRKAKDWANAAKAADEVAELCKQGMNEMDQIKQSRFSSALVNLSWMLLCTAGAGLTSYMLDFRLPVVGRKDYDGRKTAAGVAAVGGLVGLSGIHKAKSEARNTIHLARRRGWMEDSGDVFRPNKVKPNEANVYFQALRTDLSIVGKRWARIAALCRMRLKKGEQESTSEESPKTEEHQN